MSTENDPILTAEELDRQSRIGHGIYEDRLKAVLEPAHNGHFVAIHLDTGDYAVASTSSAARFQLRARRASGAILTTKIGVAEHDPLAYRILASELLAGQRK